LTSSKDNLQPGTVQVVKFVRNTASYHLMKIRLWLCNPSYSRTTT